MKKIIVGIVLGIIVTFTLLLSCYIVFGLTTSLSRNTFIDEYEYENHDEYLIGNAEIYKPIANIDIDWITGNITIKLTDDKFLTIQEETKEELESDFKLRYMLEDSTLYIKYSKSDLKDIDLPVKNLIINVPREYFFDEIDIDSVSSFITVSGISVKNFECNTVSGRIQLSESNITHSFVVESTSGNVDAINLDYLDRVDISTISGNINIKAKMINKAEFNTTGGNVYINVEKEFAELDFETISGNLELTLPENFSAVVTFDSVSGDFSTNHPSKISGEKYIFGEGDNRYKLESIYGDVIIK